jgi:hypothetical protein
MTGWTIRFLASGVKVTESGVFGKDYGESDVTIWQSNQDGQSGTAKDSVLAFRHSGPRRDYLWRSGISKSITRLLLTAC